MRSRSIWIITSVSVVVVNRLTCAQCDKWQRLGTGMNESVSALAIYKGELIAGGSFSRLGCKTALGIAGWDGLAWHPLVGGVLHNPPVYALTEYNGELIVGGQFDTAGGQTVNGIASWNGSTWQPLGSGMSGQYAYVWALAVYQGDLIAGGQFTGAGGTSASYIARWDGSEWHPLGDGMSGGFNTSVGALLVYNGELVAGGEFAVAGTESVNNIARWNGSAWQPLGSGMNNRVFELTVYDGELIAGGFFETAGGQEVKKIARWDGSTWHGLGAGMETDPDNEDPAGVHALTVFNGDLIAGGYFSLAGDQAVKSIARWDGMSWHAMGNGVVEYNQQPYVIALATFNDELIVGGEFDRAGAIIVQNVASWRCDPCLADVTNDHQVNANDLSAIINSWGPCPPQLPPCPGDVVPMGGNGVVDANDLAIVLFYLQFGASCDSYAPCQCPPDVDGDNSINAGDVLAILAHWGPCPLPAPPPCPLDTVQDGAIGAKELLMVINSWGPCP